jgi:hypothetical protein
MPSLLSLAAQPTPNPASISELSKTVSEALATAEQASYRMDELLVSAPEVETVPENEIADDEPEDEDLDAVDMAAIIEQGTEIDDDLEFQEDEDEV